ncbi:hypothetical protein [Streptomyces niveus]|uniref:Uncharacterized protein n=1 Tax=Streptomyces niveus TaxID=193462 RepID=A0ABZ2A0H5_STRNV|nr:hypothetical protein [Streptomyces niveus]
MTELELALSHDRVEVHPRLTLLFRLRPQRRLQGRDRTGQVTGLVEHMGDMELVGSLVVTADGLPAGVGLRQ